MKKTISLVLAVIISISAFSQDAIFVAPSVSLVKKLFIPGVDVGVKFNKNELSFNMQTYDPNTCKCKCDIVNVINRIPEQYQDVARARYQKYLDAHNIPRQWVASMRYERLMKLNSYLAFVPIATAGIQVDGSEFDPLFVFTAGAGLKLKLTKNFALQASALVPYYEQRTPGFRFPGLQNAISLYYYKF